MSPLIIYYSYFQSRFPKEATLRRQNNRSPQFSTGSWNHWDFKNSYLFHRYLLQPTWKENHITSGYILIFVHAAVIKGNALFFFFFCSPPPTPFWFFFNLLNDTLGTTQGKEYGVGDIGTRENIPLSWWTEKCILRLHRTLLCP